MILPILVVSALLLALQWQLALTSSFLNVSRPHTGCAMATRSARAQSDAMLTNPGATTVLFIPSIVVSKVPENGSPHDSSFQTKRGSFQVEVSLNAGHKPKSQFGPQQSGSCKLTD